MASHVVFALDVLFPVECFGGVVYFGSDTLVWVVIVEDLPQQVKKGEKFYCREFVIHLHSDGEISGYFCVQLNVVIKCYIVSVGWWLISQS